MAALKFASSHNMVAFLDKPTKSDGFKQIVDFLNAYPTKYPLTVNPTIYTSCIEQFWTTAKVKTINGEVQIQALVDKKKVIITETSIRSDLQLEDAEGTECLPNATIFEHLTLMVLRLLLGINLVALWPLLSSVLPQTKNSTFPMFLDKQVEGISKHKEIYVTPSHTKKVFANMKSVPTHYNDPLLSGEDRLKLNELMELCTSLSQRVLALETTKTNQALEIDSLKRRVNKLEKKKGSRTHRLRRLYKVGISARVVSSEDEGTLVDVTQGRYGDNLMFDTGVLDNKQDMAEKEVDMVEKDVCTADPVTTAGEVVTTTNVVEIKAIKPKAVTTTTTTTTTAVTRPKARGVAKDKGKAKMVKLEKPLKKKDQIMFDKEFAQKLQAQLDAKLEEEEKLARQRRRSEEQGELTIEEKSRLFVELMNKRKKHFTRLGEEEQRRKPPTKAQKRNIMSTYLKNMARYKHNQLKTKSFEDIQMLFDKEMKRVNTFVDMDTELVKGSETRIEVSSKRAGEELESKNLKKQKLDVNVKAKVDDDQEEAEMKKHMEIVPDDEVAIDAIPLATKPPIIVD
ncbi:hypothetical protein Tco_1352140 [Tanacetum coccineum]